MRALMLIVAVLAAACCGPTAWCDTFPTDYNADVCGAPTGVAGPVGWAYWVANTSGSMDYSVWLLQIEVDENTDILSVQTPAGWRPDTTVPHLAMWTCSPGGLAAGASLTGFAALFGSEPTTQGWTVMFRNSSSPGDMPVAFGMVSTPEPASILAILTGLASVAASSLKRRR